MQFIACSQFPSCECSQPSARCCQSQSFIR